MGAMGLTASITAAASTEDRVIWMMEPACVSRDSLGLSVKELVRRDCSARIASTNANVRMEELVTMNQGCVIALLAIPGASVLSSVRQERTAETVHW